MDKIPISQFKAKCLAILEQVHKTKKPIRVTRFGRPIAEVIPPSPPAQPDEWLGMMSDTMEIVGDIMSPIIEQGDWEALRE